VTIEYFTKSSMLCHNTLRSNDVINSDKSFTAMKQTIMLWQSQ